MIRFCQVEQQINTKLPLHHFLTHPQTPFHHNNNYSTTQQPNNPKRKMSNQKHQEQITINQNDLDQLKVRSGSRNCLLFRYFYNLIVDYLKTTRTNEQLEKLNQLISKCLEMVRHWGMKSDHDWKDIYENHISSLGIPELSTDHLFWTGKQMIELKNIIAIYKSDTLITNDFVHHRATPSIFSDKQTLSFRKLIDNRFNESMNIPCITTNYIHLDGSSFPLKFLSSFDKIKKRFNFVGEFGIDKYDIIGHYSINRKSPLGPLIQEKLDCAINYYSKVESNGTLIPEDVHHTDLCKAFEKVEDEFDADCFWTGEEMISYKNIVGWFSREDGSPIFVVQFEPTGKLANIHPFSKRVFTEEDKLKLRQRLDEQRKQNQPPHLDKLIQMLFPNLPSAKSLAISDSCLHSDNFSIPFEFIDSCDYQFGSYFLVLNKITHMTLSVQTNETDQQLTDLVQVVQVHKLCWSLMRLKRRISTYSDSDSDSDIVLVKDVVKLIESGFERLDERSKFIEKVSEYQEMIDEGTKITKNNRYSSVGFLQRKLASLNINQ